MAMPTETEKGLIAKFREELKDALDEERLGQDHYLLRWIRAREHNLPKAKEMILKSLKWREENDVDHILNTKTPLYFQEHFRYWIEGADNVGRPLLTLEVGKWRFKDMIADGQANDVMNQFTKMLEMTMQSVGKAGNLKGQNYPITQFVILADFHDFSYGQVSNWTALSNFITMTSIYEGQYPETLFAAYLINCPKAITWVLPVIKRAMSGTTINKLHEFGTDAQQWYPKLLQSVDAKYLSRLHRD